MEGAIVILTMALRFEKISDGHLAEVSAFNRRLSEGGISPDFHLPDRVRPPASSAVNSDCYVALDGEVVRGGYLAQWRQFLVAGDTLRLGDFQLPVSEGIVEKRFAAVGMMLLRHALGLHPYWYTVGMGGLDQPLPRLLKASGWYLRLAPFLFRVNHASRFCQEIRALRTSTARKMALDLLAATGLAALACRGLQWRSLRSPGRQWDVDLPTSYEGWADRLWDGAKDGYSLCAERDALILGHSYPLGPLYHCVRIRRGGTAVAWAIICVSELEDNAYFGGLRLGIVLDCFGEPEAAPAAAFHAARILDEMGAELCATNQTACAWLDAFRRAGFLDGPSNYGVSLSKAVVEKLSVALDWEKTMHVTRGDGDGRVNLLRRYLREQP